jgi:hypothetical protein
MAATPTEKTGGSQTAVISTEHTLATITDAGTYVLVVDTGNMLNGDELEIRIKTKVRSGNSSKLAYFAAFAHIQVEVNKVFVPVPTVVEFVATLKQTAGTGRAYIWSIYAL